MLRSVAWLGLLLASVPSAGTLAAKPPAKPSASGSRAIAHGVLLRVAKDGAFADRALNAALSRRPAGASGGAHATELTYGVLRHGLSLDHALEQLAARRKTDLSTWLALRIGAYELLHMRTPDHAAVSQAVGLVPNPAKRRFTNGVLRNLARRRDDDSIAAPDASELGALGALSVRTSTPAWLLEALSTHELLAGADSAPAELEAWARACQERPQLALRVNRLRGDAASVTAALAGANVSAVAVRGLPEALLIDGGSGEVPKLPGFDDGAWSVQDVAAQLVGLLSAPSAGQVVLELCSAPGGKTCHLAELMGDEPSGRVVACELHARKLGLVEGAAARLGLRTVRAHAQDATDGEALRALLGAGVLADAVVLDAPCSGTGTLRRNPEHRYREAAEHLPSLCALQDRLLDSAAGCVRVGGSLTYSVCSPLAAEGTERVAAFLARHVGFEAAEVLEPALQPYVARSALLGERRCVQTWTHRHDGLDSFFAAKLVRRT